MIVREIMEDATLLQNFDFFNDTKDTLAWLRDVISNTNNAKATVAKAKELHKTLSILSVDAAIAGPKRRM